MGVEWDTLASTKHSLQIFVVSGKRAFYVNNNLEMCFLDILSSYEDYFKNGKWANRTSEECSDPKEVLENAVFKQEDIVEAWISYFDDDASGANITWNSIESVRTDAIGRCFTMNTDELKAHGIAVISLHIKSPKSYVSVHTKGLLLNANGEELSLSRYIPMGYDVHLR